MRLDLKMPRSRMNAFLQDTPNMLMQNGFLCRTNIKGLADLKQTKVGRKNPKRRKSYSFHKEPVVMRQSVGAQSDFYSPEAKQRAEALLKT